MRCILAVWPFASLWLFYRDALFYYFFWQITDDYLIFMTYTDKITDNSTFCML